MEIQLTKIRPNPDQARRRFDKESIDQLADSIRDHGLIQPITVRPIAGGYQIISGERRFRAHQALGLATIKCLIASAAKPDDDLIMSLIENIQREDLTPVEEAEAYQKLLATGLTQGELGKRINKSQPQIAQKLALLNLPAWPFAALKSGAITEGHGRQLLRLQGLLDDYSFPEEKEMIGSGALCYSPLGDEMMRFLAEEEIELGEEAVIKRYEPKAMRDVLTLHQTRSACLGSVAALSKEIDDLYVSLYYNALMKETEQHPRDGICRMTGKIDFASDIRGMIAMFRSRIFEIRSGRRFYDEDENGKPIQLFTTPRELEEAIAFAEMRIRELEGAKLHVRKA